MKTSYFAGYRGDKGVCIALQAPKGFNGSYYEQLYPKWWFLKRYKKDHNQDTYIDAYYNEVLSKLDPQEVYNDLKDKVLLCWEKPGDFCHRRVVASWIELALPGIKVQELGQSVGLF